MEEMKQQTTSETTKRSDLLLNPPRTPVSQYTQSMVNLMASGNAGSVPNISTMRCALAESKISLVEIKEEDCLISTSINFSPEVGSVNIFEEFGYKEDGRGNHKSGPKRADDENLSLNSKQKRRKK